MELLGLTGGVGTGKSTSAEFLRQAGVPVVDTDALARQVVEPGQPALEEIRRAFGPQMIGPDGRLRREELARVVFADAAARARLESIIHPRVRTLWQQQAAVWRQEGQSLGVVVIPLLYETNAAVFFTHVVCTACTPETQRRRLLERGWSLEQMAGRCAAQWPLERKMDLADFVIWTEGSLEVHAAQVRRLLEKLRVQI